MANQVNIKKTTTMKVNPTRPGSNAGAKGGRPEGWNGKRAGKAYQAVIKKQPQSKSIAVNKNSSINLGAGR